jgi:hypothetical protein
MATPDLAFERFAAATWSRRKLFGTYNRKPSIPDMVVPYFWLYQVLLVLRLSIALRHVQNQNRQSAICWSGDDQCLCGGIIATTLALTGIRSVPARWVFSERLVVHPFLRVYGVSGLRIADASVMPTITSGNTNAPTIVFAKGLRKRDLRLDHQRLIWSADGFVGTDRRFLSLSLLWQTDICERRNSPRRE